MLILDTNVLSALRRPDRAPPVAQWLARQTEADLYLSVITLGEIERGISLQENKNPTFAHDLRQWMNRTINLFSDRLLPFDAEAARLWGGLSAKIGHTGADLQIAATALALGATVVTQNTKDFEPTGCQLENPLG